MPFLDLTFYGNDVRTWLIALVVFFGTLALLLFVKRVVVRQYLARLTRNIDAVSGLVANLAGSTRFLFILIVALYAGAMALNLPAEANRVIFLILVVGLIIQGGLWANELIAQWLARYRSRKIEDGAADTALTALGLIARVTLWSVVVLLVLDNLGIEVTALVASLGIGAVAVGLAVQNILGDLLASLSILLDKPFVVGDFIVVGDFRGTVEKVGIQTTRLRSLGGEQLIFSNNDLVQSRISNYKRMQERRIVFSISIEYETPYEKLAALPSIIREIIGAQDLTRFDRAHFFKYGDFSLDFEIVYYVLSSDYSVYMDTQQAINLALFRRFNEEGIKFAYPTQTLHLPELEGGLLRDGRKNS
jgi:small-conductance mechanosensitive channel